MQTGETAHHCFFTVPEFLRVSQDFFQLHFIFFTSFSFLFFFSCWMDDSFRILKEKFVSGLTGTTNAEVVLVTALVMAVSFFSYASLIRLMETVLCKPVSWLSQAVLQFIMIVIPSLIALTFADWTLSMLTFLQSFLGLFGVDFVCRTEANQCFDFWANLSLSSDTFCHCVSIGSHD